MGQLRWGSRVRKAAGMVVVLACGGCEHCDDGAGIIAGNGSIAQAFSKVAATDQQTGSAGAVLPTPVTVLYEEGPSGNVSPAGNQEVTWTVTAGGGTINLGGGEVTTGKNRTAAAPNLGKASVVWTMGPGDAQRLTASTVKASGQGTYEVEFTASVDFPTCRATGTNHAVPISASEAWLKSTSPHHVRAGMTVNGGAELNIQAGAVVCVDPGLFMDFTGGARLVAIGGFGVPVLITRSDPNLPWNGIRLTGQSGTPSRLDFVVMEYAEAGLTTSAADPVLIDHTIIRQSGYLALGLAAPGSDFRRSTVEGTLRVDGIIPRAAVEIAQSSTAAGTIQFRGRVRGAAGVAVKLGIGNVEMESCEITGNVGIGIQISAQAAGRTHRISQCNIFSNGGVGVANPLVGFPVDARGNWWGDPAGPLGPAGDGVSGDVNTASPIAGLIALGYAPSFSALLTMPARPGPVPAGASRRPAVGPASSGAGKW